MDVAENTAKRAASRSQPARVLIVGGGIAGLEAALALHAIARAKVQMTLLTPTREFVYRPLRVREPFAERLAPHYPLEPIAADIGVALRQGELHSLDPVHRVASTKAGEALPYDALLLAPGARQYPQFRHALTIDPARLDAQLHGLIADIEDGYVESVAFLAPNGRFWPLPLYELALLTAHYAYECGVRARITIVSPEAVPLQIFGTNASAAVHRLLAQREITFISAALYETLSPQRIAIHPGHRELRVNRMIALPELIGPSIPGLPGRDRDGFIATDSHCEVLGLEHVFAAGDATAFPVKHGSIAAQQADVAASAIAAFAGAAVSPRHFRPSIQGILLTGGQPLYLSAQLSGSYALRSQASDTPTWAPATKIAARHLATYLIRQAPGGAAAQPTRHEHSEPALIAAPGNFY